MTTTTRTKPCGCEGDKLCETHLETFLLELYCKHTPVCVTQDQCGKRNGRLA